MKFEDAVKKVDRRYKKYGFPGLVIAKDAGSYWIFQTKVKHREDLPPPILMNKETGEQRWWDYTRSEDNALVQRSRQIDFQL